MKKGLIALLFCFVTLGLLADEVTNPFALPAKKKFLLNIGYEYLSSNIVASGNRGTVQMNYFRGIVFYGVTDKLSLYIKAGMSDFNTKATKGDWEQQYGFGAKSILFEKPFKLSVDFHLSRMYTDGESKITGIISDIDWQELQLALASAYDYKSMSTYFGMKFHLVEGNITPETDFTKLSFKQDKIYSFFGGFSYPLAKKMKLEMEGGVVGEYYISIACQYAF